MRIALKLAVVVSVAAALGGCTAEQAPSTQPTSPVALSPASTPASPDPAPVASPTAEPTELEPLAETPTPTLPPVAQPTKVGGPWTPVDVTVTDAEQVKAADALPETFRTFLASRVGVEDDAGCTTSEVVVKAIHPDGFAFGSEESDCGGGQVIWGIDEGAWHYINQFEDAIPCTEFVTNEVPPGAPGLRCLDENGDAKDF